MRTPEVQIFVRYKRSKWGTVPQNGVQMATLVEGVFRFANYYQDNMVLQRAPQRAIVWGYGDTNVWTTLWINHKFYHTMSGDKPVNEYGESI
jgi:hypothetical protein